MISSALASRPVPRPTDHAASAACSSRPLSTALISTGAESDRARATAPVATGSKTRVRPSGRAMSYPCSTTSARSETGRRRWGSVASDRSEATSSPVGASAARLDSASSAIRGVTRSVAASWMTVRHRSRRPLCNRQAIRPAWSLIVQPLRREAVPHWSGVRLSRRTATFRSAAATCGLQSLDTPDSSWPPRWLSGRKRAKSLMVSSRCRPVVGSWVGSE